MKSVTHRIRRTFITGLVISLPLVITIFILKFLFESFDNLLGPLVTSMIRSFGAPIGPDYKLPGIGLVSTVALIFLIGLVSAHYVGRRLWDWGEAVLTKIPIIRPVYVAAKQVIDTFSTNSSEAFRKVVVIEYPRRGMYTIGFITGPAYGEIKEKTGADLVNVFVPTTPNPTSGFLLLLPKAEVVELDIPVEDGVKMIVSCGLVTPERYNSNLAGAEGKSIRAVSLTKDGEK
jgi:uncharacterized membrane protein